MNACVLMFFLVIPCFLFTILLILARGELCITDLDSFLSLSFSTSTTSASGVDFSSYVLIVVGFTQAFITLFWIGSVYVQATSTSCIKDFTNIDIKTVYINLKLVKGFDLALGIDLLNFCDSRFTCIT